MSCASELVWGSTQEWPIRFDIGRKWPENSQVVAFHLLHRIPLPAGSSLRVFKTEVAALAMLFLAEVHSLPISNALHHPWLCCGNLPKLIQARCTHYKISNALHHSWLCFGNLHRNSWLCWGNLHPNSSKLLLGSLQQNPRYKSKNPRWKEKTFYVYIYIYIHMYIQIFILYIYISLANKTLSLYVIGYPMSICIMEYHCICHCIIRSPKLNLIYRSY